MTNILQRAAARIHRRLCARFRYMRVSYLSPREVVLITTRHEGQENVWPVDWHAPLSHSPPLYGVSMTPETHGTALLHRSGVFVVNFMPFEWQEKIVAAGRVSGRDVDKFATIEIPIAESMVVDAPRVDGALGHLECEVVQTIPAGDHVLIVGAVKHSAENGRGPRLAHVAERSDTSRLYDFVSRGDRRSG